MNWYLLWPLAAGASLTLALVHVRVWLGRREEWASLLFSAAATATAVVALTELMAVRADTTAQYATIVRWAFIPFWVLVVSLIGFVRLFLGTGRRWLALVSIGLWTLTVILNFLLPPGQSLTYKMVTGLRPVVLGGETFVVAEGVANPWNVVTYLGVLFMLVFVVDASIALWRQGGSRRRAVVVGGSVSFFILLSGVHSALVEANLIRSPYIVSFCFLAIVIAMGGELSHDLLHSIEVSQQLKRSETELRQSEQRLSLAAESAGVGMWSLNSRTNSFWVTDKNREIFGLPRDEEVTMDRFLSIVHPEDLNRVRQTIDSVLESEEDARAEYRIILPDGSVRWISSRGRVRSKASGDGDSLMGVSQDITDRRRIESALLESEERFRAMTDSAPMLIWLSDSNDMRTDFNRSWLEFTGRTLEQERGRGWSESVHPDDLEQCLEVPREALRERRGFTHEYRLRRHDGHYRWMLRRALPRFLNNGDFAGFIGCCIDVTDLKEADAVRSEFSGRLIRAQEEERARIARELHDDFTQRLAMLTVNLERAWSLIPTEPESAVQYLHKLWEQTSEIGADLHKLSHKLHSSVLDVLGLVEGVRSFCEEFAAQGEVQVEFTAHDVPRTMPPDTALCLFRITQEALTNVKKHSGANLARVQLSGDNTGITLSIADSGVGFDPMEAKFEVGLGLRGMRERLRVVAGTIEITSRPGAGTQILVHTPVSNGAIPKRD